MSTAREGTVQPQNCKERALERSQTQCWGGCAVIDCQVQRRKLGLGAPDAFRKRRTSVTEPYLWHFPKKWTHRSSVARRPPSKTPQRGVRCGRSERTLTEVALPSPHARTFLAHRVGAAAESRWTIMWVPLCLSRVGHVLRSVQIRRS